MTEPFDGAVDNVLIVVVDALRPDRVGAYTGDTLTPNIDGLAADGEVFEQCFACINATDSSMTTLVTGQYPTRHGVLNHGGNVTDEERRRVADTVPLPTLVDETHATAGIDMLGRWHKRGFDEYLMDRHEQSVRDPEKQAAFRWRAVDRMQRAVPGEEVLQLAATAVSFFPGPLQRGARGIYHRHVSGSNPDATLNRVVSGETEYLRAEWVAEETIATVGQTTEPWLLLAHFWDTHLPYSATAAGHEMVADRTYDDGEVPLSAASAAIEGSGWAETVRQMGEDLGCETVGDLKRLYDASVYTADAAIGRIVSHLKETGAYEDTAVIVTADHGESLTEHDVLFDHHGLYDPTVHVPFIVKAPGFEGREDLFVQHYDVVPTVLELLGYNPGDADVDGQSLVPATRPTDSERTAAFMEEGHTARKRAIRTEKFKYIKRLGERAECRYCDISHGPDRELYDVAEDPSEDTNLAQARPHVVDDLDELLETWIEERPDSGSGAVEFDEDPAVIERLEDMGYR